MGSGKIYVVHDKKVNRKKNNWEIRVKTSIN